MLQCLRSIPKSVAGVRWRVSYASYDIGGSSPSTSTDLSDMAKLKYDPNNFRLHGEQNKRIIHKSLVECGAGRSILIDKDDCIIAGNGVYEQAQCLGIPVRIIETDGNELIAVKRNDLTTNDNRRKLLALADNHASDTSIFNDQIVLDNFSVEELEAWEFSVNAEGLDIDLTKDLQQGAFVNQVRESSDSFQVTFTLPKTLQVDYEAYVHEQGKDNLLQILISEICQSAEVK